MKRMSRKEYTEFLGSGTRTGKLATVREDGRPHVVPIWFVLDGDKLVFNTGESTVKAKNILRDPRVSISVDDQAPPYSFVTVEGEAKISEDRDECLLWATRIGERYMGENRAEEFGKRNSTEGELTVKVSPTKVLAYKNIADY